MLPRVLIHKAAINPPIWDPIHHPIPPKTIMPMNIQSLFISYPTLIIANDNYTIYIKHKIPSFNNHFADFDKMVTWLITSVRIGVYDLLIRQVFFQKGKKFRYLD